MGGGGLGQQLPRQEGRPGVCPQASCFVSGARLPGQRPALWGPLLGPRREGQRQLGLVRAWEPEETGEAAARFLPRGGARAGAAPLHLRWLSSVPGAQGTLLGLWWGWGCLPGPSPVPQCLLDRLGFLGGGPALQPSPSPLPPPCESRPRPPGPPEASSGRTLTVTRVNTPKHGPGAARLLTRHFPGGWAAPGCGEAGALGEDGARLRGGRCLEAPSDHPLLRPH